MYYFPTVLYYYQFAYGLIYIVIVMEYRMHALFHVTDLLIM